MKRRIDAIKALFQRIESTFGGDLSSLISNDTSKVITSTLPNLTRSNLASLLRHEVLAVHVKSFVDDSVAEHFGSFYLDQAKAGLAKNWQVSTSQGLESSDVMTIGTPMNMINHPSPSSSSTQDPNPRDPILSREASK